MSVSGREAIPDVCEWSVDSPGSPGVLETPSWMVWRHTQMSASRREAFPNVREWSGGLP